MNLFADIRALVIDCLTELTEAGVLPSGLAFDNIAVEPPRDASHGDMATNAAMVLAKPAGMKPRDIAQALADKLSGDARVATVEVAGPGFLNLSLDATVWAGVVKAALSNADFGKSTLGAGKKINVEYVSANPTGPLHVGHTRGAIFGDALASLLDYAGFDVTREYYINDGGGQVDVLARSVYLRYLEAHGQEVTFEDGTYPGDYLIDAGEALKAKVGDAYVGKDEDVWLADVRSFSTDAMMDLVRTDLASLGIKMDNFFSEKSLYGTGRIEEAINDLKSKDLIYWGSLKPPKGKLPDDWVAREQWLFKSTDFGDDEDRAVQKGDGTWTYFAPDIAYHFDKVSRGFNGLVDVFGADHTGYVKRMKAAVAALSNNTVTLDIKLAQIVRLFKNGEEFKMSKRAGTFITVQDLVDEVGKDVARFIMLMRKNDTPFDFDFDKVTEQSKDNPVFYVQYANARVHSVLRKAHEAGVDTSDLASANMTLAVHPAELTLAGKVAEWPRVVDVAARSNEPHRVALYLYDLASEVHALWNRGNDDTSLRFLQEDNVPASQAKIALIRSASVVISHGLGILGVTPAEEMR